MPNTLSDADLAELAELGRGLLISLSCDANGDGYPCRTDRLAAVADMKRYLELHDYVIKEG
jgi:hypothetical protein